MHQSIKRLLFTEEPHFDESFVGYVMRLAELNEISEMQWILKTVGLHRLYDYDFKFNSDFRVDSAALSKLSGIKELKLKNLLYVHEYGRRRQITGHLLVFGQPIQHYYVVREKPKICPLCLAEQVYCRKVWELSPVTVCPIHKCQLTDKCSGCSRSISWIRAKLNICHCGFDFRQSAVVCPNAKDLRLSEYFHQQFGLPDPCQKDIFKYPLNTLCLADLLTLLFFVAAHFAEMPDYIGAGLSKYKNNQEIHAYLSRAVKVFDGWAKGYYDFIAGWKKSNVKYFINCKQMYLAKVELPREHGEYELFNQILHNILFEQQFSFMHEEFREYLARLPSG